MKRIIFLLLFFLFFCFTVQAEQYDGKWENKTSKYSCNTGEVSTSAYSYLFNDDIIIQNNKVRMGNSKTIGKVKKNILGTDTIGMNTIWGHLGGKIKYNSMQLKFTPTFDTWKPLSKCNYKFVKLVTSATTKITNTTNHSITPNTPSLSIDCHKHCT